MNEPPSTSTPLTVMLVDDAELIRLYLRRRLERVPGLEITHEAADVPDAIAGYDRTVPDVLVLDLQMPSGTGLDVLRHVRSRGGDCLVIMLSAAMDEQRAAVCREAGANHCFDKATEFERIREVILERRANRG